jgi:rsbT antagonist protein RsbS
MASPGIHLTRLGGGDFLLEPSSSLNVRDRDALIEEIAGRLMQGRASHLYYDLSERAIIDPVYYDWLNALARAMFAINVRMVCIHMQPTAAYSLAQFITELPSFGTAIDIASWQTAGR